MELHCIRCGQSAAIKLDLDDCDLLTCPECDEEFSVDDVRQHCEAWMRMVAWIETSPARKGKAETVQVDWSKVRPN